VNRFFERTAVKKTAGTVLEDWAERGATPTRIVASHSTNGVVDRIRPRCPYSQAARYMCNGSIDAAENSAKRRRRRSGHRAIVKVLTVAARVATSKKG
jgi:hypothetical protein